MPMLVLPDGSVLTWDATPTPVPPVPLTSAAPITSPVDATQTDTQSDTRSPTQADVATALARVPPKWQATFMRFVRTLVAGTMAAIAVAWATTGGTIEGVTRAPQAFAVAVGTAIFMAAEKAIRWRDE